MENKLKPTLPRDQRGSEVALRTISASLAVNAYNVTSAADQDVTLNTLAGYISIVVLDSPCFLRAQANATSSDFDYSLCIGQHDFMVGNDVTVISFIGDGGTSRIRLIQRQDV